MEVCESYLFYAKIFCSVLTLQFVLDSVPSLYLENNWQLKIH